MPRKPRFFVPGLPVHAIQRGNNRQAVFFCDEDCREYLGWLKLGVEKYACQVHAYVLMTNHVHLLLTPERRDSLSGLFQYVGRHYVSYVNRTYSRTGTLWEGRYKASLIQDDGYLLTCSRYIELNPVRAGMVSLPEQYPWSSYRANGLGENNPLLAQHRLYQQLGVDDNLRQQAYRALFKFNLDAEALEAVRACLQSGTPLGNDRFRAEIEQALDLKVGQVRRGRPIRNRV